jgi:hypothetical protein
MVDVFALYHYYYHALRIDGAKNARITNYVLEHVGMHLKALFFLVHFYNVVCFYCSFRFSLKDALSPLVVIVFSLGALKVTQNFRKFQIEIMSWPGETTN